MIRLTGYMDRYFFRGGQDPGDPPIGTEEVRFRTADGVSLSAWWTPADRCAPGQARGTVIHAHGNTASVDAHHEISAFLTDFGFNVLLFDYRGYGRSNGRIRRREDGMRDLAAAIHWVRQRNGSGNDAFALLGQSIGGALCLMTAPDYPEVKAVVAVSPFATWRRIAAYTLSNCEPPDFAGKAIARLLVREKLEPLYRISLIKHCPVRIYHGTNDQIVPYTHGYQLAEAAQKAGVNITLRAVEGGDHNAIPVNEPPLSEEIAMFLQDACGNSETLDFTDGEETVSTPKPVVFLPAESAA